MLCVKSKISKLQSVELQRTSGEGQISLERRNRIDSYGLMWRRNWNGRLKKEVRGKRGMRKGVCDEGI